MYTNKELLMSSTDCQLQCIIDSWIPVAYHASPSFPAVMQRRRETLHTLGNLVNGCVPESMIMIYAKVYYAALYDYVETICCHLLHNFTKSQSRGCALAVAYFSVVDFINLREILTLFLSTREEKSLLCEVFHDFPVHSQAALMRMFRYVSERQEVCNA